MDIRTAHATARVLMDDHGLEDWAIAWDRAVKRYGQCNYGRKTLSFSRPLTEKRDPEGFKNTVLHEIAHALTRGHNHDRVWRAKFLEIGGDGTRCSEGPSVEAPWTGVHDGCDQTFPRHRRPKGQVYCPKCYRRPRVDKSPFAALDAIVSTQPDNSRAAIRWVRTASLAATVTEVSL